jgi:hypothetical protein
VRDLKVWLASILFVLTGWVILKAVNTPPEPHSYLIARWNPHFEAMIRPTPTAQANPRLLIESMVAERYERAGVGCYVFYYEEQVDTLCEVLEIRDQGVFGRAK